MTDTISPLDAGTRRRILGELAGSAVDHGPYRPVTTLFEAWVDRTPHRPALSYRDTTLSYRQLDRLANGLAAELAGAGVRRGDVLPVLIGNSLELPLCLLALLKLGAAFVPCDPAWPAARLRTALDVLTPRLVLTAGPEQFQVDASRIKPRAERPELVPGPDEPAYGVFTSGTTGTPKCAINVHRGLTNRLRFMSRFFPATGAEVVLQNSRHTFDSAIWQLLWPLTTGGRAVVPEQGEFLDLERTVATIAEHRVTVTDFVPATLSMLVALLDSDPSMVARLASLRHLVVGGEEVGPRAVHRLRTLLPGLTVFNGYGPSEASIGMVFHPIEFADGDHVPLGRPIDNCYAVVVDERLRLLPPGELGEIVIGGACLGGGYLGDPVRTAERFVTNPFPEIPGARLYRTGDLGWFDDAGLLRFSGRADRQVQVAGVRIELGEIEIAAQSCPGVRQAKAMAIQRGGETVLALAVSAGQEVTPAGLRAQLSALLPRTSVPHRCVVLPALPLTDNGKVDLPALRSIVDKSWGRPVGVGGSLGERIAGVLGQVLGLPGFGVDDDFLDGGGDSLRAWAAVLELRRAVGEPVSVRDLYEHRTPAGLAAALTGGSVVDSQVDLTRDVGLGAHVTVPGGHDPGPAAVVFVTGATGFLGAWVTHLLLATGNTEVVCLVRAGDNAHARNRVIEALRAHGLWDPEFGSRLDTYAGDLGRPRFGLAHHDWEVLAARCDAVLHVGALVNLLLDYRAHRPANVLGTAEIVEFAMAGRVKPVHHVSTLGVLERQAITTGTPVPESFDPAYAVLPSSGYSQSKWVAERIVLEARRRGAPVTIYRLGELMPARDNGVPNGRALTHLLLNAFHRLGVCPDVPMLTDYTPVDEAAARLVAGLRDRETRDGVVHVFHGRSVSLTDVTPMAVRRVPEAEFLGALRAADADPELALLLSLLSGPAVELRTLLTDNPALFAKDACVALDRRHGLADGPLDEAIAAYHRSLARG